jgi:hypothetical protein
MDGDHLLVSLSAAEPVGPTMRIVIFPPVINPV